MAQKLLIDATHDEETRIVVVEGNTVREFDFETSGKKQIVGNIYLAKVARIEPALQAVFVDFGENRFGFLAYSEIHPDYFRIPIADREPEDENVTARQADGDSLSGTEQTESGNSEDRNSDGDADLQPTPGASISGMDVIGTNPDGEFDIAVSISDESSDGEHEDSLNQPANVPAGSDHAATSAADKTAKIKDATNVSSESQSDPRDLLRQHRRMQRKYKVQEVVRNRQILLVQVLKNERGNKGAAVSTYITLPGRYCVLTPNSARGTTISRKITGATDRKRLEKIAKSLEVPEGAGLIVRTAGGNRTKQEIKRDYDYLVRQWDQIRSLTLKSIAPAPIYEEGGLIKRTIRDVYSKEIDSIIVTGHAGYRMAKDFMKMILPSHAKKVQEHGASVPLFTQYRIEEFLDRLFEPVVQLKSGGYIVINITEALVAIDVNSGRSTSQGTLEKTAFQTNLEAAAEIALQARLRDLAGLIVIDFIDMSEWRNNTAVEKCLRENFKPDRARVQFGRISNFGLLEMSRQRLRPGIVETISNPCKICDGTGYLPTTESIGLSVLRKIEAACLRGKSGPIQVRVSTGVANFIFNRKREIIDRIEKTHQLPVRIVIENDFAPTQFEIEIVRESEPLPTDDDPVVMIDSTLQSGRGDEAAKPDRFKSPGTDMPRRRGGRRRDDRQKTDAEKSQIGGREVATAKTGTDPEGNEQAETPTQSKKSGKNDGQRGSRREKSRKPELDKNLADGMTESDATVEGTADTAPETEDRKPQRRKHRGGRNRGGKRKKAAIEASLDKSGDAEAADSHPPKNESAEDRQEANSNAADGIEDRQPSDDSNRNEAGANETRELTDPKPKSTKSRRRRGGRRKESGPKPADVGANPNADGSSIAQNENSNLNTFEQSVNDATPSANADGDGEDKPPKVNAPFETENRPTENAIGQAPEQSEIGQDKARE